MVVCWNINPNPICTQRVECLCNFSVKSEGWLLKLSSSLSGYSWGHSVVSIRFTPHYRSRDVDDVETPPIPYTVWTPWMSWSHKDRAFVSERRWRETHIPQRVAQILMPASIKLILLANPPCLWCPEPFWVPLCGHMRTDFTGRSPKTTNTSQMNLGRKAFYLQIASCLSPWASSAEALKQYFPSGRAAPGSSLAICIFKWKNGRVLGYSWRPCDSFSSLTTVAHGGEGLVENRLIHFATAGILTSAEAAMLCCSKTTK